MWCALFVGQPGAGDPLAFLRSMPQFAQFRAAIQRNPQMLQPLLQELGQSNPELLAVSGEREGGRAAGVSGLHLVTVEKGTCFTVVCASEYLPSATGRGAGRRKGRGEVSRLTSGSGGVPVSCSSSARTRRGSFRSSMRPRPSHPRGRGRGRGRDRGRGRTLRGRAGHTTSQ